MQLDDLVHTLRARGVTICPSSTGVPVELRGVLPDGSGFWLTCRGVRVVLRAYARDRVRVEVPHVDDAPPEQQMAGWQALDVETAEHLLGAAGARIGFAAADQPDAEAVFDGARELGWTGHRAGLLRPAEVLPLFTRLHAALTATARGTRAA